MYTLIESGSESESEENSEDSNKSSSQSENSSSESDSDKKKKTQQNKKLQKSASKDRYRSHYNPCDKNEPITALIHHLSTKYSVMLPVMCFRTSTNNNSNVCELVCPSDFK